MVTLEALSNILIITAGILWGIELIPQVLKTIKTKNVEGISPLFFITCMTAYTCYMFGNILAANWVIVWAHIPSLVLTTIMITLLFKYRKR